MTIGKGYKVTAADYQAAVGTLPITSGYASSSAATGKLAALWGIGYGDRGYGQTSPSLPMIVPGMTIQNEEWLDIESISSSINTWTNSGVALPNTSFFQNGDPIYGEFNFISAVSTFDTNRLNTNASYLSTTAGPTSTRATTWGAGSSTSTDGISCTFTVTFTDEANARWFFNQGGLINFWLTQGTVSTTQDTNWSNAFTNLGTIKVGANSFAANTGSFYSVTTNASTTGYYQLTTTSANLLFGDCGTGSYSANTITVASKVSNVTGTNGGNGYVITFVVSLNDNHSNSFADVVSAGTKLLTSYTYNNYFATLSTLPTIAITTGF